MTKILEKIESEVICIIDDKQYQYTNGKEAYQQLTNNYSITYIKAFNNQIILNLNPKENNKEQDWQEEYKKQFGEEPSCFNWYIEGRVDMALKLMYITNNSDVALIAQKYGVDRIWIDLETLGKEERQKGMNTVKSNHSVEDIKKIAPLLTTSEMLVRINPINENSEEEINKVIDAGADIIMLPMWKSVDDVNVFLSLVNSRTKTTLLLETKEAAECLDDVLEQCHMDEIHIGLNDLHLSYGLEFMFELLSNGTVERLCNKISKKGIPYGFGGIAKIGEGTLPAEKIVMEHYKSGSTRAILSRSFCNYEEIKDLDEIENVFSKNIKSLKEFEQSLKNKTKKEFQINTEEVIKIVNDILEKRRASNEIK